MRRFPILLPVLLLAACDSPTGPDRGVLARTALAEARWLELRPWRYELVQARSCECTPEMSGPVRVLVEQLSYVSRPPLHPAESILEATYLGTDAPVPAPYLDGFLTVRDLFALIRQAVSAGAARVVVEFDPHWGYPALVSVDYDLKIADDEFTYSISAFRPLDVVRDDGVPPGALSRSLPVAQARSRGDPPGEPAP